MDSIERQRKLEAGKAKFAEYRKKKGENVVKVVENGRNPSIMDELTTKNNEEEEMEENSNYGPSIVDFTQKIEEYNQKICEYQSALKQRDDVINQLTERLKMTIEHRDRLRDESTVQSEALVTEIDILKLQLQQANEFLQGQKGKNGISAEELLEARNQAIALQQLLAQRDSTIHVLKEEISSGLRAKDLENTKLQEKLRNSEEEGFILKNTVVGLRKELETVRSNDTRNLEAQLKEKSANLEELKLKSSEEVMQLMEDLQDLQRKFVEIQMESEERLRSQEAELDERYGNQIAEMGVMHKSEMWRLKDELSSVVSELDSLKAEDTETWHEKLRELISEKETLERDYNSQLVASKEKISSLEQSLHDLREKETLSSDYKVQLDISNERIVALEQLLRDENDEHKVQLDLLRSEKENLEGDYKLQLKASSNRVVVLERILREQSEETKLKLEHLVSERQIVERDYKEQLVACNEQIAALQKALHVQMEETETKLERLVSERDIVEGDYKEQLVAANEQLVAYMDQLVASNEQIASLETALRVKTVETDVKLRLLSEREVAGSDYKEQLVACNEQIASLQKALHVQTEETETKLERLVSERDIVESDYKEQLVAANVQLLAYREQLVASNEQIASLEKFIQDESDKTKLRIDVLISEKDEHLAECLRLSTELVEQRQSYDVLKEELDVLRSQRDQLENLCEREKARGCLDWDISINFGSIMKQIAELREENDRLKTNSPLTAHLAVEEPKSSSLNSETHSSVCTQTVGRNEVEEWKEKYEDLLEEKLELEIELSNSQHDLFGSSSIDKSENDNNSTATGSLPLEFLVRHLSDAKTDPEIADDSFAESFANIVEEEDRIEEISRLQSEIETLRLDNVHLQKELMELNASRFDSTNKKVVAELTNRVRDLASELELRQVDYEKVVRELETLRKSYDNIDVLKNMLESKVDEVEREGLKVTKVPLLGTDTSEDEVGALRHEISQLRVENSCLREKVSELCKIRDELLVKVETLKSYDDVDVLRRNLEAKVAQTESELIVRENAVVLGGCDGGEADSLRGNGSQGLTVPLHSQSAVQTYDAICCECGVDVECQVNFEDLVDSLAEVASRQALVKACSPDTDLEMVRNEMEQEFSLRLHSLEEELLRKIEEATTEKAILSEELREAKLCLSEYKDKLKRFESLHEEENCLQLESENGRLSEEVAALRLELNRVREAEGVIRKELQAQYDEDVEHVRQCLENSFVREAQASVEVEVAHLKEKVEANIVARNEQNDLLYEELQELKVQVEQLQADKQRLELSLDEEYTSVDDVQVDFEDRQTSSRHLHQSADQGNSNMYIHLLTNITSVVLNLAKTIDKEFVTLLGDDAVDSASDGKAADDEEGPVDDQNGPYSTQFGLDGGSNYAIAARSDENVLTFLKDDPHGSLLSDVELSLGEIVNEAGNRLSNAVRRLLDLFRESVQQLQDSHVVQDQLANSSLQSNNEVESLTVQNEELTLQLKSIEQTKDCLAVELTKTTDLLRSCETEKCALEDLLSRKEKQYSQVVCQLEEVEARNQSLEESLAEDHCQRNLNREIVAEGIGERHTQIVHSARNDQNAPPPHLTVTGDEELLEENSRLHLEKRGLQHRGEKDRSQLMLRIQELEQTVEEMAVDRDLLVETKRQETEDLQQQIDALDKQLKAYKQFVEEQTAEREQEREDFHREVALLNEAMKEKEKGLSCGAQLTREVESLTEQLKEKELSLKQALEKREQIEREFDAVNDKLNAGQEVIRELERQLDCKSRNEHDLKEEMDELRMALSNSARANEEQSNEIEVLRSTSMSVHSKTPVPPPFLEDFFDVHGLDTTNGSTYESLILELRSRMHTIEDKFGRNVRDLEAVHFTSSSLSSPCSEEVSVREQLEALRSMARPDASMDVAPQGLEPSFSEYVKDVGRLEDRIDSLTRAKEVAVKRIKDLEVHLLKQKQVEEELVQDRDVLQQQLNLHLVQISALQARLEEQRLGLRGTEPYEKISLLQEELAKQNDVVETKSKQIEDLQDELSTARNQVKGYEEEVHQVMERYNKDVSQSKAAKALATLETNELKSQLAAYKDNLEESKKQSDDLSSLLQTVIQEKNQELDMLTAEIQRLEQEKAENAEHESRNEDEFLVLQQTVECLNEELAASKKILTEKEAEATETSEKLSSLEKDLKRAVDTVEQKRREVDALKVVLEEKAQLVEQVQMLQNELLNLNNYQTRLQDDFDVVQSMLEEKQAELATVIQEMAEMQSSRDNSLEEQLNARNRLEALQKEIAEKLASSVHVSIQTDFVTELQVLRDEKEQLETKFATNCDELLAAKSELSKISEQLAAAEAQVNDLENTKVAAFESLISKMKSEANDAVQQRTRLEAEIAWRNSKIFRLEDEVEQLRVRIVASDETPPRSTVHKFLEEVQKELIQEQVDEIGSLDLNVQTTISTEGSLSESDADSIVESLPSNVRSMVKKIYKEGINVLNLSELKFVQEHSASDPNFAKLRTDLIERSWENEKLQLVSEIQALKDLLSQVTTLATSSRTASTNTAWLSQLFVALSSLLTTENNLLMATVQSAVVASQNTNLDDIHKLESSLSELKRVFKNLLQAMQRIKTSIDSSVSPLPSETKSSSAWEIQMAVAKERLKHQEQEKKLMQELRQLDRQMGQNDRQAKRQTDLLKFRIQQELIISEDLQRNLDLEKSRSIELCGELTNEKGRASQLELTTVQLKSELVNCHMTVEQFRQELKNATQLYRTEKARAESLFQALQGERDSFAQLQEAMEAEKRRSKASHVREQQIIDELRNALETEREKQLEVTAALERERLALQKARKTHEISVDSNLNACLSDDGKLQRRPSESNTSYVEDMEAALDLERRKNQDLSVILQKEHHRVSSLTSSLQQERRQLLRELETERTTIAQLKCKLEMFESQKNNLVKELQRSQEHSIRIETEHEKTASDLSSARTELERREQELDALRHIQQDVQKEHEIEREKERHRQRDMKLTIQKLQQRITFLEKELEFAKSNETNLRSEIEEERQNRATFPRSLTSRSSLDNESRYELLEFETLRQQLLVLLFRLKDTLQSLVSGGTVTVDGPLFIVEGLVTDASNLSKQTSTRGSQGDGPNHLVLVERIVKHNSELAQFAHELCEEKLQLRMVLSKAKDDMKIPSSTQQNQPQNDQILIAERAVWAQERAVLQRALHRAESELLRNLSTSRQSPLSKVDDSKAIQFYYKYLRAQSFRKNLIYQKNYLLILLSGYHDTETATLDMLGRLGCISEPENDYVEETSNGKPIRNRSSVRRFRGVVRLVVAVIRMRYLVSKWRRVKNSVLIGSSSSRSLSTGRDHEIDTVSHGSLSNSVYPAFTPPVRDDPTSRPGSDRSSSPTARRGLLLNNGSSSSSNRSLGALAEYVQRFDSIQQQLGLGVDNDFHN